MKREILINAGARETRVAILEDEKLVELLVDRPDNRRMVGDVYLGKVEAVLPGIQAAFVDIGTEKSAFLHASDLVRESAEEAEDDEDDDDQLSDGANGGGSPSRNGVESIPVAVHQSRRGRKAPPIQDALKRGQEIMVQISKEPISTKGPRVTAQISLAGRFLVYIPDSSRVGVSRKIGSGAERQRLKEQVAALLSERSGGVIVRTVSEDVTPEALAR
ncbi:MAG TPA: ribonuclease E/G, partial [Rhodothermia bacterium]|nr:ribonuclease E/G [Rhodothermia bacterium]